MMRACPARGRRTTRFENIDRDKFVLNALFFQSKPDSTHIDAVRSTENNWMLGRLHEMSPYEAQTGQTVPDTQSKHVGCRLPVPI
jgi:hypothetical protein